MAQRPSPDEIREMLKDVRDRFHPGLGNIDDLPIKISNRMRSSAGFVDQHSNWKSGVTTFSMIISGPYHDHFGWGVELFQTLKHEIIHIARPHDHHGAAFHAEMYRTEAVRYCRTKGRDLILKGQYHCKACGHIFKTADRAQFCPLCDDLVEQIGTVEE